MLDEAGSQKNSRRRTRWWIWWKKRTKSDHELKQQVQSKLLTTRRNEYIPNDVIIEILSRLPGKSLIQFRWTCKYWFDLITKDSSFAKLQLVNHAINNPLLMLSCSMNTKNFGSLVPIFLNSTKEVEVDDNSDEGSSSSGALHPTVTRILIKTNLISIGTVEGSCNGLLLIKKQTWDPRYQVIRSVFCIWNPCTKEFKESCIEPIVEFPGARDPYGPYCTYGFGYDRTNDDYKVISYTMFYYGYASVVQVYTLGTSSWKRIGNHHPYRFCSMIKFVPNGASFYCIGKASLEPDLYIILCFDIVKEDFREISKPWFVDDLSIVQLIELNGCLCIAQYVPFMSPRLRVEVWMVKDYCHDDLNKNEYSWTKLYTIRQPDILRSYVFKPVGIFNKNGDEILIQMRSENDLYWYNVKDDQIHKARYVKLCSYGNREKVEAYVESLVSLNSGTYMGHEEDEEEQ